MKKNIRKNVLLPLIRVGVLAAGLMTGYYKRVFAGTCSYVGPEWVCTGAASDTGTDAVISLNNTTLTVTTDSTFGHDTSSAAGDGLVLTATAGAPSFTDTYGASITGHDNGIWAQANSSSAILSITTSGNVTGLNGDGINASNTGDVTIKAYGDVSGSIRGIVAESSPSIANANDVITIIATGTVTGGSGAGIWAKSSNNDADLTSISAHNVYGGTDGIYVYLEGYTTNGIEITTSGTVRGTKGNGITARVNYTGSPITISANNVSGGKNGIYAYGYYCGSRGISITTSGDVVGNSGAGIKALGYNKNYPGYSGNVDITVGSTSTVSGSSAGIYALADANNGITITTSGNVSNISGSSTDAAITAVGAPTTINFNDGSVTGTITTDTYADTFNWSGGAFNGTLYTMEGDDTVNIGDSAAFDGTQTLDGGDGDDTLNFSNSTASATVANMLSLETVNITNGSDVTFSGGTLSSDTTVINLADSTLTVDGATIAPAGGIVGTAGEESLTIASGTVTADFTAGDGVDTVAVSGGSFDGSVDLGTGNDSMEVSGGTVSGNVDAGAGNDSFTWSGGTFTGQLSGEDGDDTFNYLSGDVHGNFYGEAGSDTFNWSGGSLNSGFYGGAGDDVANIEDAAEYDGAQVLDGGEGSDELNISSLSSDMPGANVIGWEVMTLDNASLSITDGALEIGDGTDGSGVFATENSTLDAGSSLVLTGNLSTDATSSFIATGDGSGVFTLENDLSNAGRISSVDDAAGDTITVGGNYSGDGELHVDVDFSTSTADTLIVEGDVSSSGTIAINDLKTAADDSSDDITLIQATTDSDKSDEHFVLADTDRYDGDGTLGRWSNSPFIWKLKTSDGNWVLGDAYDPNAEDPGSDSEDDPGDSSPGSTKPAVVPEIPAEVSLPAFAYEVSLNKLNTLHQRMGELRKHGAWANPNTASDKTGLYPPVGFDDNRFNTWARSTYAGFNIDGGESFEVEGRYGLIQLGFDRKFGGKGNVVFAGFHGSYIQGDFDNSGQSDHYGSLYEATTDVDGWAAGFYGTWMNDLGTYVDLVFDYMRLDAEIKAVDRLSTDGDTISGSIEAGQSLAVISRLIVEPQFQFKVSHITWDGFFDGYNNVSFEDHTYVTGRAGLRTEYTFFRPSGAEIKP